MKKYNFVYRTINTVNGRSYIGVHSTNCLNDSYMGSGKILRLAIKQYGLENFHRIMIFMAFDKESAYWAESLIVTQESIISENLYNIRSGGIGGLSDATIIKLRKQI